MTDYRTCTLWPLTIAAIFLLASCATAPHAPKVVQVTVDRYVPIPADLSAECPIPGLTAHTVGGAIELAINLKGALVACNDRMSAIRGIQGSPAK